MSSNDFETLSLLKDILKRVKKIERITIKEASDEPDHIWLNETEAMLLLGIKNKRKLWELRRDGKVDFKSRPGTKQRDFKYTKASLEALYC